MENQTLKLQVLISTMHQENFSLLDRMNVKTDAIVINQCDKNEITSFERNGHTIQWFSLCERGVGVSRNSALARAKGDILLFADEDVVYEDDYEQTVISFFQEHPKVGLAVFNIPSLNPSRPEYIINKDHRLRWYNCLRYGAFRIAVRRECLTHNNVWFSLLFGGGALYQAGEDNLFITDCIKNKIRCMASKGNLGTVKQEESTWFKGYDRKYYTDRGALFAAMYGRLAYLVLFMFELRGRAAAIKLHNRLKMGFLGIKKYLKASRCRK